MEGPFFYVIVAFLLLTKLKELICRLGPGESHNFPAIGTMLLIGVAIPFLMLAKNVLVSFGAII